MMKNDFVQNQRGEKILYVNSNAIPINEFSFSLPQTNEPQILFPFDTEIDCERKKDFPQSQWSVDALSKAQGRLELLASKYHNRNISIPFNKIIEVYNAAFGYNNWSTDIMEISHKESEGRSDDGLSLFMTVVLKITLKDGTYVECIGDAIVKNYSDKSMAFNNCKKLAFTNCLKGSTKIFKRILQIYEEQVRCGIITGYNDPHYRPMLF
ncbi:hypothetical protein WICMUC_001056 [Wickerhamomyces mucosus]|uniref:DNA repair and recombination protein RAD52 n=1 Tax=Wickerhamomyces mucosus TaxID=1378264 RepID=A0A9P8PXF3_9ASCO|nr:hypothetical protein WICMUC_001056 [Wickerhamomyces mucosus]